MRLTFFVRLGSLAIAFGSLFGAGSARATPSSTSVEQAYDMGDIESPRWMAFGGAQTALGASTTAIYDNPANLASSRVYHFEGLLGFSPEANRQTYGGGIADSSTNQLAARPAGTDAANGLAGGVGGTWSTMDPDGINRQWTDLRVALAYPVLNNLFVGVTGPLLASQSSGFTRSLRRRFGLGWNRDDWLASIFTFAAGVTYRPIKALTFGIVGANLTDPNKPIAPTTLAGGIGLNLEVFSLEADALVDFTTYGTPRGRFMAGAEVFLFDRLALRVGYRIDTGQKTQSISAGSDGSTSTSASKARSGKT